MSGQFESFERVALLAAARTPWIDYGGALAQISPIDLGIHAARGVLARAGIAAEQVDSVLAGSMAQASFDAYMLPRHIGLYAGVPLHVPALAVQRICGTGLELLRQAGNQVEKGASRLALCVATESMSRNPIASYEHRSGFRLGAPVGFKDFLWEALLDPAIGQTMIDTAHNLAMRHGLQRNEVDAFALGSFEKALAAQAQGWFDEEIVPVVSACFELDGYQPRGLQLPRKISRLERDSHPRATSLEALAALAPVTPGSVQTAGNSCALVDGAAAALVADAREVDSPLALLCASAVVGVPPEVMGIGPAPAIRLLLQGKGLQLDAIDSLEINEAQGAQIVAVQRELELDPARLNRHGGAIALGHPLAATGLRLAHSVARQLRARGTRYGIAAACIGGGQGMALLLENPACT
ncbi:thiolase family protein [Pseudomonas aeruginosa]|uniref:thiolase family protein n=1 Tax=Pseudomonas aeruginosa TaxID=287 RepID=UPI00053D6359|nr:thiolase family protein [Pseudomonas aeruginosa]MCO2031491.1 thiolase family protein [Pseudomonas aeruginosa]MCS7675724.1 thiolase family protein [Pseudomonas aeruginosa]MCS7905031.1 thiolase family protein [Pseudomonas aeruginosa]MCS9345794.1 thiolase family protein [Pseudomonas aeruginosa]MCS9358633.1 thiolase family protein [Pseudomonas aeruginosa]